MKKCEKFPHYYNSINKIEVIVDGKEGGQLSVEIIASAEHNRLFVATEKGDDLYKCIDLAAHKIERQISQRKEKERNDKKHADSGKQ